MLKRQGVQFRAQPQELVIDWGRQLCGILDYLHGRLKPIIYGDMKPANIILQPDGKLVLIDFGIAGEIGSEKMSVICTKGYAAPEQYFSESQIDIRTDIYSLGVTLHQLVTGKNPIESPNELKPIRQYNPELSEILEQIIEKCIQPDLNLRFQSIRELKEALVTDDTILRD